MQNRTDYAGLPIRDRLRQTAGQYRRALEMAAAAAGGAVFAGAHILGGIAPFGVALAAAVPEGLFLPALFGALFGYLWFPAPGSAMEYAAAILLLGGVRWTLSSGSLWKRIPQAPAVLAGGCMLVGGVAAAFALGGDPYRLLMAVAVSMLAAGSAWFFARSFVILRSRVASAYQEELGCLYVTFLLIAAGLLSSADAVFRKMTVDFMNWIRPGNVFNIVVRVTFLFFTSYALTSYLCKRSIPEEVKDRRKGEPVLAITIMSLLSLLYLLFSGIQIFGLFLGKMQLPEGYTYAQYAREGFFQLLAVSILNLILVLVCLSFFRESKVLKVIMTIMSLCTFIMIASSVMRMIIYIRYYYLTFLRIFVLWMLAVLFVMFIGVLINIYRESFRLFRYGVVMVTVLYLALSFSHPDYIIARVNIANAPGADGTGWEESVAQDYGDDFFAGPFFRGSEYGDFSYLSDLSADAAPAIIPYMESLGYDFGAYELENPTDIMSEDTQAQWWGSYQPKGFGYYYLNHNKKRLDQTSLRTFNISRYMARKQIEARIDGK